VPVTHIGTGVDLRITDRVLQVYSGQQRGSSGSGVRSRDERASMRIGTHHKI